MTRYGAFLLILLSLACGSSKAQVADAKPADSALATKLGADERGMRNYVMVILKSGPDRVADGPERVEMFKGHFANIERLAADGKLALAGPFTDKTDWRGMFILAVETVDEARLLVATDPVIVKGEMVAEYHRLYSSAALMAVNGIHHDIAPE
jgi:uncharacterized protein YciI